MVADAFHKRVPLFTLGVYNPYAYYTGDDPEIIPAMEKGRRGRWCTDPDQLSEAFRELSRSIPAILLQALYKLLAWLDVNAETEHELEALERWKRRNGKLIGYEPQFDLLDDEEADARRTYIPRNSGMLSINSLATSSTSKVCAAIRIWTSWRIS